MTRSDRRAIETLEITGHLSPADKENSAYVLLPFDVPEGVARLEVGYSFSEDKPGGFLQQPGNLLDIGLFDPRGSEFLSARGFRGWSGSARREFAIGADEATPGYLPGPILPGRWEIVLGLVRILPEGCDYCVTVRLFAGDLAPSVLVTPAPSPVLRRKPGWYRGDLHCHTHHSDAKGSLADLVQAARDQGLDFLAVTDHNTVSHLSCLAAHAGADLFLIPGMEITTEKGHANAWGIERWHEFRCETPEQMAQVVEDVRSSGALISINHPKMGGPPWRFGGEDRFDCLEVWQAPWFVFNDQSLGLWDRLLKAGHRITAVGGSDVHQMPPGEDVEGLRVGQPCTWVYAQELSQQGILAGIRAGQAFISESPLGPKLLVMADVDGDGRYGVRMGDSVQVPRGKTIRLRCEAEGAAGCQLRIRSPEKDLQVGVEGEIFCHEWLVQIDSDTHVRAELWYQPDGETPVVRALSNPIYFTLSSSL